MNLIKTLLTTLTIVIGLSIITYFAYATGWQYVLLTILFLFGTIICIRKKDWDGLEISLVSWFIFYIFMYQINQPYLILPIIILYYLLHKKILPYIIICPIASFQSFLYQIDDLILIEGYETSKYLLMKQGQTEEEVKQYFIEKKYDKRHKVNLDKIAKYKLRGADFDIYKTTLGKNKTELFGTIQSNI